MNQVVTPDYLKGECNHTQTALWELKYVFYSLRKHCTCRPAGYEYELAASRTTVSGSNSLLVIQVQVMGTFGKPWDTGNEAFMTLICNMLLFNAAENSVRIQ